VKLLEGDRNTDGVKAQSVGALSKRLRQSHDCHIGVMADGETAESDGWATILRVRAQVSQLDSGKRLPIALGWSLPSEAMRPSNMKIDLQILT
jgi:hypothetical protein